MASSAARVATGRPPHYLRQICRHFGHNVQASHARVHGTITFADGMLELDASDPQLLVLAATAQDADALERIEQVVASYLERIGRADDLTVAWT